MDDPTAIRELERQRRRLDKAATFDIPALAGGFVASVTATPPLQSSGGLTPNISFISQLPNLVLATDPVAGTTAPAFRALVNADLPVINIAHGGTNSSAALTNGRVMISSGGAIVERAALTAGALTVGDATNGLAAGPSPTYGALIYGSIAPAWIALTGNITTTKMYLSQTGDGVSSATPAWTTIAATELTGILGSTHGGTGINNAGTLTNASNTTITGGGTLALGGFTLTIPATGTVAMGTGAASQLAYWSGTNTLTSGANLTWSGSGPLTLQTGAAGNIGLIVKGAASQSANLTEWQNSSASVLTALGPTGHIAVGANAQSNIATIAVGVNEITTDIVNDRTGVGATISFNSASNSAQRYAGGLFTANSQSASAGNLTNAFGGLVGGDFTVGHNGSGTVTTGWAGWFSLTGKNMTEAVSLNVFSSSVTSGATWTNYYGIKIADPGGSGTITNNYGLYIGAATKGGTLNYAIYSAGGQSYHAGNFGIGQSTPTALLHLAAGTATAGTAPLRFTSGTVLTVAVAGTLEFTTDDFFATITTGAARKAFILDDGARLTSGKIPVATTNGRLIDSGLTATRVSYGLFDYNTDAGCGAVLETDLYSDTIAASQLGTNKDKLSAEYGGVFVSSATATRQVKIYFGGTAIFDTGALTLSLSSAWTAYVSIIRVSSTVIRYMISFTTEGAALAAYTASGELTGLTLSSTNILKITGLTAGVGAAANDIVAKLGTVSYVPAA